MTPIQKAISLIGGPAATSKVVGMSTQTVCFWRDGLRCVPTEKMALIERACGGAVTRKDLRPMDWHVVWPELAQASINTAQQATKVAAIGV